MRRLAKFMVYLHLNSHAVKNGINEKIGADVLEKEEMKKIETSFLWKLI